MATSKVLLLDIGNRQLKTKFASLCSAFDWREQKELDRFSSYLAKCDFELLAFASSAPQIDEKVLALIEPYSLREISSANIPMLIESEGTGVDRLLTTYAAHAKSQSAAIVVDLGTAFTIDVVSGDGVFIGGAIGPGLGTQIAALKSVAPHLAAPAELPANVVIPQSTSNAVFAGTIQSLAIAIQKLVLSYQQQLGESTTVFLCGGDASKLQGHLPQYQLEENLLFEGMQLVLRGMAE
jgi:pantothenate kinase type III